MSKRQFVAGPAAGRGDPLPRVPLRCPRDGRTLAETDGVRLYLSSCMMVRTVTLHCLDPDCTGHVSWYPGQPRR